jgi:polar amino acid transport system substrate-binding protein
MGNIRSFLTGLALVVTVTSIVGPAVAQQTVQPPRAVPFFDLARKPEKPDLTAVRAIRFLTEDDYPPFHFLGPDGQLTGFNVDLARAVCEELMIACTIQSRRWDTLLESLAEGRGDAVIASLRSTEEVRRKVLLSVPYYRMPGRFVARFAARIADATPAALKDRRVAVVEGTAHASFVTGFFPAARLTQTRDLEEAIRLISDGAVEAIFADGVTLSFFLNAEAGKACCRFLGGPFHENRFFGEGAVIAFRKDSPQIKRAVDHALFRLAENGVYEELLLKYFPVRFY